MATFATFATKLSEVGTQFGYKVPAEADVKALDQKLGGDAAAFKQPYDALESFSALADADFKASFPEFLTQVAGKSIGDFRCDAEFIQTPAATTFKFKDDADIIDANGLTVCKKTPKKFHDDLKLILDNKHMDFKDAALEAKLIDGAANIDNAIKCGADYKQDGAGSESIKFVPVPGKARDTHFDVVDLKCKITSQKAGENLKTTSVPNQFKHTTFAAEEDKLVVSCEPSKYVKEGTGNDILRAKYDITAIDATLPHCVENKATAKARLGQDGRFSTGKALEHTKISDELKLVCKATGTMDSTDATKIEIKRVPGNAEYALPASPATCVVAALPPSDETADEAKGRLDSKFSTNGSLEKVDDTKLNIKCNAGYKNGAESEMKAEGTSPNKKFPDETGDLSKYLCKAESADDAVTRMQAESHFKDVTTLTKKDETKIEIACKDDKHQLKEANKDKTEIKRADANTPFELADFSKFATCEKKSDDGGDDSSAARAGSYLFVSALAGLLWIVL